MAEAKVKVSSPEGRVRLEKIVKIANRYREVSLRTYKPHPGQVSFHQSRAVVRGLFPGNGWGKTVAAVREVNYWCLGKSPFRDDLPEPPVNVRHLADGWETGVDDILIPIYQSIVEPADLEGGSWDSGYSKKYRRLQYKNGSRVQFMSYNLADRGKGALPYAGKRLDLVVFDEHGPFEVWNENQARIGKRELYSIVCLTPVRGMTWEHDEIYMRWERGEDGVECFTGEMTDNPHLSRAAVQRYLSQISDPRLRDVRKSGAWINLGGDVYPQWDESIHVVPYSQERVDRCTATVCIDPHPSKPTAVLWCGIEEDGTMFAYREHRSKNGPADIAEEIRALSENKHIRRFVIDPHWGWENNLDKRPGEENSISPQQQFENAGLRPMIPGSKQKWTRIDLLRKLLEPSATRNRFGGDRPYTQFQVMKSCPQLSQEFPRYRFKPQTEGMRASDRVDTIDERNDLLVCAEYFVMSNPVYMGAESRRREAIPEFEFDEFGYPRQQIRGPMGRQPVFADDNPWRDQW